MLARVYRVDDSASVAVGEVVDPYRRLVSGVVDFAHAVFVDVAAESGRSLRDCVRLAVERETAELVKHMRPLVAVTSAEGSRMAVLSASVVSEKTPTVAVSGTAAASIGDNTTGVGVAVAVASSVEESSPSPEQPVTSVQAMVPRTVLREGTVADFWATGKCFQRQATPASASIGS